jgi:hypothetical protein
MFVSVALVRWIAGHKPRGADAPHSGCLKLRSVTQVHPNTATPVGRRCHAATPANQTFQIVPGVVWPREALLSATPERAERRALSVWAPSLSGHDGKPAGLPYQLGDSTGCAQCCLWAN